MNALHISIYGRVQAVGFRNWIRDNAKKKGLFGWARNASDGSVEVFLQGNEQEINDLLAMSWEGPNLAEVDDVLTQDSKVDDSLASFEVY